MTDNTRYTSNPRPSVWNRVSSIVRIDGAWGELVSQHGTVFVARRLIIAYHQYCIVPASGEWIVGVSLSGPPVSGTRPSVTRWMDELEWPADVRAAVEMYHPDKVFDTQTDHHYDE